jgi:outer membrane lipoprotein carrier protein
VKVFCALLAAGFLFAGDHDDRLKAAEQRYNTARSLQVDFQQQYLVRGKGRKTESGRLSLQKPGRMLWQYRDPDGKFFLTDGKFAYLYVPRTNRVEKAKLKETADLRSPVAFLLGKLSFKRDFEDFAFKDTPDGFEITAYPKRKEQLSAEKVIFVLSPQNEVRRLVLTGIDNSVMEFTFSNEKMNIAFAVSVFRFEMPSGADLVEVSGLEFGGMELW